MFEFHSKQSLCLQCKLLNMQPYIGLSKTALIFVIFVHITVISGNDDVCGCYMLGTVSSIDGQSICDNKTLQCKCYPNVIGKNCNECQDGFYNILSGHGCTGCHCSPMGSVNKSCNTLTGQCQCQNGFTGFRCDQCGPNKYKFSPNECKNCNCNPYGSKHIQCNIDGQCSCLPNTEGDLCNRCKENTYSIKEGCIPCPPCYEFVQNSTKTYQIYLNTIEEAIEAIENNIPLMIQDYKHFLNEIKLLKAKIYKLKLQYDEANATDVSDETINRLTKEAEAFHEQVLDLIRQLDGENKKKILDNLYIGRKNLKEANEFVKICEEALVNATKIAKTLNRHNKTMTLLAKEALKISEKIEEEAEELYQLSLSANSTCSEACGAAEGYYKQQEGFNNELEDIKSEIVNTTKGIAAMKNYSKNFQEATKASKEKALKLKEAADLLVVPNSELFLDDLKEINASLTLIEEEMKNLRDKAEASKEKEESAKRDLEKVEKKQKNINDSFLLVQKYEERADVAINKSNNAFESAKESLKNLEKFKEIKDEAEEALKRMPEIQAKVDAVLNNSDEIKNIFLDLSEIIQDLDKMNLNVSELLKVNEENLEENENNFKILEELEEEERKLSIKLAESHAKLKGIKANLENLEKQQVDIERDIKQLEEYILFLNILPTTDEELDEVEEEIKKMEEMVLAWEYLKGEKEKLEKEMQNVKDIIESIPIEDSSLCESAKSEPKTIGS